MSHFFNKLIIAIFFVSCNQIALSSHVVKLSRVENPTQAQIKQEQVKHKQREFKRTCIKYGYMTAGLASFYLMCRLTNFVKHREDYERIMEMRVNHIEGDMEFKAKRFFLDWLQHKPEVKKELTNNQSLLNPIYLMKETASSTSQALRSSVKVVKDGVVGIAKNLIELSPSFIASLVVTATYEKLKDVWTNVTTPESVSWYIREHTQVWDLLVDIKSGSVHYDLHSALLSADHLHGQASSHLKDYIANLTRCVKDRQQDEMIHDGFFEFQCEDLRQKYTKKGNEVEVLQNYAAPVMAKRQRNIDQVDLFQQDIIGKQDIGIMCNLLAQQVQQVASFALVHLQNNANSLSGHSRSRGMAKIEQLIDLTNQYLQTMEELLAMSSQELEAASQSNKGMFTVTYEFEKIFREYVNGIHRYCKLIS
ncbi:MAG: hypothetical protein CL947_01155 [Epsilonproteobacteria bacterium]|nr:hypothetical protein [Campylobacterota bacterium]